MNVGVYATADKLGISGILWKENKDAGLGTAVHQRGITGTGTLRAAHALFGTNL